MYTHFLIKPLHALALCCGLLGLCLATLACAATEPPPQATMLEPQNTAAQAELIAPASAALSLAESEQLDQAADLEVAPAMPQVVTQEQSLKSPVDTQISQDVVSAAEEKPKPKPSDPNVKPSSQNPWEELSNWFKQYQRS